MASDAVERAIQAAEAKRLEEELAKLEPRQLRGIQLLDAPHLWDGSQEITINAPPDDGIDGTTARPVMLLYDANELAWRAILLPAGSAWRVVPDRSGLWTPT